MQKKLFLPVAVLGLALVSTACNQNANDGNLGMNAPNTPAGPDNVTYRGTTYTTPTYPRAVRDGFRGVNNPNGYRVNPGAFDNTLNGARDLNPNLDVGNRYRTSLNDDANQLAELAAGVNGVDSAKAVIIGGTAYVGLDISERLSADRAVPIQDEVVRVLQRAMPRYDIRVTSDKGFFQRIGAISTGVRNGDGYDRYTRDIEFLDRNMNRR